MDHYERLGVDPSASPPEIRAAYRDLARRLHPDARGGHPSPEMAEVNEAWRVLSDPGRRAAYDASRRAWTSGSEPPGAEHSGEGGFIDDGWSDDGSPLDGLSPAELRAAHRFGVTLVVAVALAAVVLIPLFVYAFIRSGSLAP